MENDNDIKARLKQILKIKKSNVSKLIEGEEIKRSTLYAQINGDSAVSADTISLFLKKFKDVSAEWLTRGEGVMCCYSDNPDAPFLVGEPEPGEPSKQEMENEISFLRQQLKLEKDKNDLLQQQLNLYEGRV